MKISLIRIKNNTAHCRLLKGATVLPIELPLKLFEGIKSLDPGTEYHCTYNDQGDFIIGEPVERPELSPEDSAELERLHKERNQ